MTQVLLCSDCHCAASLDDWRFLDVLSPDVREDVYAYVSEEVLKLSRPLGQSYTPDFIDCDICDEPTKFAHHWSTK